MCDGYEEDLDMYEEAQGPPPRQLDNETLLCPISTLSYLESPPLARPETPVVDALDLLDRIAAQRSARHDAPVARPHDLRVGDRSRPIAQSAAEERGQAAVVGQIAVNLGQVGAVAPCEPAVCRRAHRARERGARDGAGRPRQQELRECAQQDAASRSQGGLL